MERTNSGSEASSPSDGFVFSSPSDRDQIKMQRQAIWDLLKHLGSQILSQGVNLTQICLPVKVWSASCWSCCHQLNEVFPLFGC